MPSCQPPGIQLEGEEEEPEEETTLGSRLMSLLEKVRLVKKKEEKLEEEPAAEEHKPQSLQELVSHTVVRWAQEDFVQSPELVRAMFSLLHYDGLGELLRALPRAYTISLSSVEDTMSLLECLGQIRSLLIVQMGPQEENLMIQSIGNIMNNKVFYQHPNLMRALGMHETVMEVMVNVLGGGESKEIRFPKMVTSCCRFLCYFCRISRQNQRSMFDHLSYLLENSGIGLGMQGSTPLDVAAASVIDNNELALALQKQDLEKVVSYLAGCGLQSCPMLLAKGYPDIGWNPCGGERYLDFLRFAVFVNGESVEENANVVVRLLIRKPECFGPALRGEGGSGLLAAIEEAIRISEDPARDGPGVRRGRRRERFGEEPPEENRVHLGHAIMSFYAALIDLLGRCAPEMHLIQAGKGEALRIRAILRSLVPLDDLVGIISLPLQIPTLGKDGALVQPKMSASFVPDHKASMVLFLDRVYGIENQDFLLHVLDVGFLPDMRAAASLDTLLTNHYERCWKYYCLPTGWANFGVTSEEELHLTRKLFWGIFDSLAHKKYDQELYRIAMPCLCAIAGALPPDYVDASYSSKTEKKATVDAEGNFDPRPVETLNVIIPEKLDSFINKFAEYTHEKWAFDKASTGIQNNWSYGENVDEELKTHPMLRPYKTFSEKPLVEVLPVEPVETREAEGAFLLVPFHQLCFRWLPQDKEIYRWPIKESLKAMIAWEWTVEKAREGEEEKTEKKKTRKISQTAQVSLPGGSAGLSKGREGPGRVGGLKDRELDTSSIEKRFAFGFLQQLLRWMDISQEFIAHLEAVVSSGRVEKSPHEQEIKFFAKILLPLINQYFTNHCLYFLSTPAKVLGSGGHASNKEKEMITSWFPGTDAPAVVNCLHILARSLDARTVMKSGPEIVKAGLRSFFESASEDIEKMVENLRLGKVSQARTQVKGVGQNLTYTTVALLPVLTTLFQHIAQHQFGDDVISRLAAAMPVAFLEPQLNEYNACSVYTTKSPRERARGRNGKEAVVCTLYKLRSRFGLHSNCDPSPVVHAFNPSTWLAEASRSLHRACNMFLESYKASWILTEDHSFEDRMIDDLSLSWGPPGIKLDEDYLYMAYADIMAKSCHLEEGGENGEEGEEEASEVSFEEKEMEKQRLLYQQSRLHNRGAAEMVLQMISACKGETGAMVSSTLKLGISILNGGNAEVQQKMLDYLKDKKEVGFFQSIQALMQTCSVLDLNAFERQNKAEGLGMVNEDGTGEKVMADDEFTQDLFRFLQLLCEGHNNGEEDSGQGVEDTESISDFYWYYSGKDVIEEQGKRNFSKAMSVAKQVFNSLTEYIQENYTMGRKWHLCVPENNTDAAMGNFDGGFCECSIRHHAGDALASYFPRMAYQKAHAPAALPLELPHGNVVNGMIARQMVDMLVESSSNVEMILKFFDMFLKLKDIVGSEAFQDYVTDPRGLISKKDFQKAMDSQKQFSGPEIQFLLSCSEADENEMINCEEFANRFQEPARDIGFNVAVLLTNLSEHVPHDPRLRNFLELAESILEYFRPYLGRIEIMGSSRRIERIYFEISETNRAQWEMPQVSDSPPGEDDIEGSGAGDMSGAGSGGGSGWGSGAGEEMEGDEDENMVYYFLEESTGYMEPALWCLSLLHTLVAFLCIIGYNCLKVRRHLSFPSNYWDKFVKRKVLDKHGDIFGRERIAELLGMDLASLEITAHNELRTDPPPGLLTWIMSIDVSFLYLGWYMVMSLLGHYNNFFFAAHLLDIAMGVKTLRTILSSVTHNGKQLVMTVGLLAVVVYLYTVVAFNFFRKFYNKSEDEDEPDMKCDDMMTVGVRAGGGIGDEIEDPAGDEYELYRVVFDITFFFFVIVILLAIIQGLIIDAFGELRDQQEQVKEDMETKCFICGIGSDYFDTTPHGFETHTLEEHNLANYMFFLMYLINKDETEHTGQESYVWKMYQERCWDFFPAGDCFRKQYEDQLS
ncbi:Ryanodine receptor 1 [Cricetulus griseus]|uniref:Ryanodine receptor 1 n=1 Tax=Cricetulus griseus TaxID=10029 RepID=G3HJA7_CRIGR|nr:Ryanodine receptor 1 [Cricetulus griseus]